MDEMPMSEKDIARLEAAIEKKRKRIMQLEKQVSRIQSQTSSSERRKRAHRLISIGAELEHLAGRELTIDDVRLIWAYGGEWWPSESDDG